MRIRSIKPEFWTSDDIADLAIEDRLLFIGLWSYVDDNGVGIDKEHLVVSELFPRDLYNNPRDTIARVSRGLQHLCDKGLIARYITRGKPFLEVLTWEKHQRIDRPNKARYPRYDADRDTLATPSRVSRETLATGTGEQGNRGTGEQRNRGTDVMRIADAKRDTKPATSLPAKKNPDYTPEFETFWDQYPEKKDKAKAARAFKAALKRADLNTILEGLANYRAELARYPDRSIKYAEGWLNGDRWLDEPTPAIHAPSRSEEWLTAGMRLTGTDHQQIEGNWT